MRASFAQRSSQRLRRRVARELGVTVEDVEAAEQRQRMTLEQRAELIRRQTAIIAALNRQRGEA